MRRRDVECGSTGRVAGPARLETIGRRVFGSAADLERSIVLEGSSDHDFRCRGISGKRLGRRIIASYLRNPCEEGISLTSRSSSSSYLDDPRRQPCQVNDSIPINDEAWAVQGETTYYITPQLGDTAFGDMGPSRGFGMTSARGRGF